MNITLNRIKLFIYGVVYSTIIICSALVWFEKIRIADFGVFLALTAGLGLFIQLLFDCIEKESKKIIVSQVIQIGSRVSDKGIANELKGKLDELNKQGKSIDSVQILEATGYNDHRKEVYILYH